MIELTANETIWNKNPKALLRYTGDELFIDAVGDHVELDLHSEIISNVSINETAGNKQATEINISVVQTTETESSDVYQLKLISCPLERYFKTQKGRKSNSKLKI